MKNSILLTILLLISNIIFAQDSFIKSEDSETAITSNFDEAKDLYTVVATAINTKLSDIGSTFFKGKYIMYSSRKTGAIAAGRDENTNNPYNGLYCLNMDRTGNLSRPSFFAYALDTKGNEGGLAFSPDEQTVYYTKSAEGNSLNYQLYKSTFDNIKYTWINEVAIGFNNVSYSIENPSLSPDGKKVAFTVNGETHYVAPKTNSTWFIDSKYEVRRDFITTMKLGLARMDVKMPVSTELKESMVKTIFILKR